MSLEFFNWILIAFSALGLVVFVALFFIKAGYGMFRTRQWGVSVPNKIGWVCMEAPVFFVMWALWWQSGTGAKGFPFLFFSAFRVALFPTFVRLSALAEGKEPDAGGDSLDGSCI